jgi:hypothetical protein
MLKLSIKECIKMLEVKQRYEYNEVKENGGCIEVWFSCDSDCTYINTNEDAWEDFARSMLYKYHHKSTNIKMVKHGTYYDGTRWVKFYEQYGTRMYQYLD